MPGNITTTEQRRLGISDLEARLHVDRATIWRWCRDGRFPAPHYLSERRMWWLSEIEAWELQQMSRPAEARRGAANLTGGTSTSPPLPPGRP